MKSGFKQARLVMSASFEAKFEPKLARERALGQALSAAFAELRNTAIYHASPDVRKVLQRQAYEFKAMWDYTQVSQYYSASSSSSSIVRGLISFAVGLGFAAAGMVVARALIGQFWQAPTVEYIWLTLAVACCLAALMYTISYFEPYLEGNARKDGERPARKNGMQSGRRSGQFIGFWPGKSQTCGRDGADCCDMPPPSLRLGRYCL